MSLINEALKKAQRLRTADPVGFTPGADGGMRVERRAPPRNAKTLVLYASSGLVLFVLAVVTTVYFINRPSPRAPAAVTTPPAVAKGESQTASTVPAIVAPKITPPPVAATAVEPTPPPMEKPPATPVSTAPRSIDSPAAAPVAAAPTTSPPATVAGVRPSGTESRVLMNDRVYR